MAESSSVVAVPLAHHRSGGHGSVPGRPLRPHPEMRTLWICVSPSAGAVIAAWGLFDVYRPKIELYAR